MMWSKGKPISELSWKFVWGMKRFLKLHSKTLWVAFPLYTRIFLFFCRFLNFKSEIWKIKMCPNLIIMVPFERFQWDSQHTWLVFLQKRCFPMDMKVLIIKIFFDKMILDHFMYNLDEQMMPNEEFNVVKLLTTAIKSYVVTCVL
jgi:hypothetical protein